MPAWAYIVLGIIALIAVASVCRTLQAKRIAQDRAGESFETFRASFADDEAPEDVLREVYNWFAEWCRYPIRADDKIADFGIDDLDWEEAVLELLAKCQRQTPSRSLAIVTRTVGDFVLFAAACPMDDDDDAG